MTRLPDWDKRLPLVTEKHMRLPGEWGQSDCLMTVGEALEAVTGENPFAPFIGKYKTPRGALGQMKRRGFANVEEVLAHLFPSCGRLMAQRGDVATIEQGDELAAGYITEYGVAVKGERGLLFVPQTQIRKAFEVR